MKTRSKQATIGVAALLLVGSSAALMGYQRATQPESSIPQVQAFDTIAAGRYLITVGGCNDCHTPGYMQTEGQVPETDWLTGSPIGWRGPWGTTYAANLRLTVQGMSEDAWVQMIHNRRGMPPMPWMNVNKLSEQDARAIYQYIRSLGPKGERMPAPVAAEQEPSTPYLVLIPQHLERLQPPAEPNQTREDEK